LDGVGDNCTSCSNCQGAGGCRQGSPVAVCFDRKVEVSTPWGYLFCQQCLELWTSEDETHAEQAAMETSCPSFRKKFGERITSSNWFSEPELVFSTTFPRWEKTSCRTFWHHGQVSEDSQKKEKMDPRAEPQAIGWEYVEDIEIKSSIHAKGMSSASGSSNRDQSVTVTTT
jgi:hypothetical protein